MQRLIVCKLFRVIFREYEYSAHRAVGRGGAREVEVTWLNYNINSLVHGNLRGVFSRGTSHFSCVHSRTVDEWIGHNNNKIQSSRSWFGNTKRSQNHIDGVRSWCYKLQMEVTVWEHYAGLTLSTTAKAKTPFRCDFRQTFYNRRYRVMKNFPPTIYSDMLLDSDNVLLLYWCIAVLLL